MVFRHSDKYKYNYELYSDTFVFLKRDKWREFVGYSFYVIRAPISYSLQIKKQKEHSMKFVHIVLGLRPHVSNRR